jgi:hypothetical protein
LKRNISTTKLNECNAQLKLSEDECMRLRGVIDDLVSSRDKKDLLEVNEIKETILKQSLDIAKLEKSKLELASRLHGYTFDNDKLKERLKSYENKLLKELINNISKQNIITATWKEKIEGINQRLSIALTKLKECCEYNKITKTVKEELESEKKKVTQYILHLEHANQDLLDKNEVIKAKNKTLDKQEEIRARLIRENEELKAKITLSNSLLQHSGKHC